MVRYTSAVRLTVRIASPANAASGWTVASIKNFAGSRRRSFPGGEIRIGSGCHGRSAVAIFRHSDDIGRSSDGGGRPVAGRRVRIGGRSRLPDKARPSRSASRPASRVSELNSLRMGMHAFRAAKAARGELSALLSRRQVHASVHRAFDLLAAVRRSGTRTGFQRLPPNPALRSSRTRTPPMPSWEVPKNAPVTRPASPPERMNVLPLTST